MMKRVARYALLAFGLLALVLTSCLGYVDVPESVRQARSNELDEVFGQVELLVPAERKAKHSVMSPDGQWLLISFGSSGNWSLLDLGNGTEQRLKFLCSEERRGWQVHWIEEHQFIAMSGLRTCYNLVDVTSMQVLQIPVVAENPARLREAESVYLLPIIGGTAHAVIGLGADPSVMHVDTPASDLPDWLAAIPHTEVPRPKTGWVQPFPSRTQCFYATGGDQEVSLYSSEGQLLARAVKDGWSFRVLGWAHDDSAIFVRAVIGGGSDGAVLYPWLAIWKLKVPEGAVCGVGE